LATISSPPSFETYLDPHRRLFINIEELGIAPLVQMVDLLSRRHPHALMPVESKFSKSDQ